MIFLSAILLNVVVGDALVIGVLLSKIALYMGAGCCNHIFLNSTLVNVDVGCPLVINALLLKGKILVYTLILNVCINASYI